MLRKRVQFCKSKVDLSHSCTVLIKFEKLKSARWDLPLLSQDYLKLRPSSKSESRPRNEQKEQKTVEATNVRWIHHVSESTSVWIDGNLNAASSEFYLCSWPTGINCFPSGTCTPFQYYGDIMSQELLLRPPRSLS